MSAPTRTRVLLSALGVVAIVGLLYWPVGGDAASPLSARRAPDSSGAPAVSSARPSAAPSRDTVSSAELAARMAAYGVLLNLRQDAAGDTGSFYFVEPRDSSRLLRELGFVRAAALLDSGTRLESHGDSAPAAQLRIGSRRVVDSALRVADPCTMEIPVPLRRDVAGDAPWVLALAPGAARVVPARVWRATTDTMADRATALRLAERLRLDPAEAERATWHDSLLADAPYVVKGVQHFTLDGTELLIADVRREHAPTHAPTAEDERVEQRLIIAERDPREPTGFRVVWHRYYADHPDEMSIEEPQLLLRMGPAGRLTLYTSGSYEDGVGGRFIARVESGRWAEVASWYGGC